MTQALSRLFRLRPGEGGLVLILAFLLFANSLALEISDVVAVSGFLADVGVPQILLVYIVDMLLVMLTAGLQSLVVDRFDRIRLIRWLSLGIAGAYILLRLLFLFEVPDFFNYAALFLLSDQQWVFFPLIFWVLASDIFDMAQAKRLFPLIAAGSFVGQIVGLGIAAAAPGLLQRFNLSSIELLLFNVGVYLVTYLVVTFALRQVKVRQTHHKPESVRETLTEGWGFVREVPSFRYLMVAALLIAAVFIVFEFHFLSVADATYTEPGSFQTFYSLFRMAVTIGAFVLQTFITSRLIERLTLKNSFFLLPSVMTAGAGLMLALPGMATAALGFGGARLAKKTIDEAASKSLLALVPEERRGRVSMFIDSYLFAIGTMIGSIVAGLITLAAGLADNSAAAQTGYLAFALAAAVIALWCVVRMRGVYDSSLFNWRLKRRQRGSSVMSKLEF